METKTQEPSEDLVDALVQLSFALQMILARVGAEHDLSIVQVRLLGILRDREPTMLQLARHLGLDKSSVTGLVDRAQRRGLLRRTAAPEDRRSTRVALTSQGRRTIEAAVVDVHHHIGALVEDLTAADRHHLSVLAARILRQDAEARELISPS